MARSPGLPFAELPPDLMQEATDLELPEIPAKAPGDIDEDYRARIRGMISDAREFNAEVLAPIRESGIKLYLGLIPSLDEEEGSSTIVATEVRDTILAMLPS